MKYFIIIWISFSFNLVNSQVDRIKEYYTNGDIKMSGKTLKFINKLTCYTSLYITKRIGKWKYFYPSGQLKQIEFYKKIKDCNINGTPEGKWQYFAENGTLIKEVVYKNGMLFEADISDIYKDSVRIGKIRIREGKYDTIFFASYNPDTTSLVQNHSFDLYKGSPELTYQDGQQHIEENLPYWNSANKSTADYYNPFRKLIKVPDNLPSTNTAQEYNYIGIILYHNPSLTYSEYITGELRKTLEPNKNYCVKVSIRLSQNSGYYIDRFGLYFSNTRPAISNKTEKQQCLPQVEFKNILDNHENWTILCDSFTAAGNEKYITLGRFSSTSESTINKTLPVNYSEGEYNQSAYYLIDDVELYENLEENCSCKPVKSKVAEMEIKRLVFDLIKPDDTINFNTGTPVILKNIQFEFDKSILLPVSVKELEKLKSFLTIHNTISIMIMGHTDNIGTDDYNNSLSLSRAKSVFDWMIEHGIERTRIQYEGYGANRPITDNTTEENRFKNRRVEFKLTKK
jgi:OOP family OmpA-OmpF porin